MPYCACKRTKYKRIKVTLKLSLDWIFSCSFLLSFLNIKWDLFFTRKNRLRCRQKVFIYYDIFGVVGGRYKASNAKREITQIQTKADFCHGTVGHFCRIVSHAIGSPVLAMFSLHPKTRLLTSKILSRYDIFEVVSGNKETQKVKN